MLKQDLIEKNPIRVLNPEAGGEPCSERMGLVMSRAGLGKTAILVQIALDSLLRGNRVMHVSINQSLEKTRTWYDDMFKDIVTASRLEKSADIHDEIQRNRMIMTFNESSFSRPKLEERLNDLIEQNIFRPNCLVIDGFDFANVNRQLLQEMRELMETMKLQIWFSAVCHREDTRVSESGVPAPCHEVDDLFDTVVLLQAEHDTSSVLLDIVKDSTGATRTGKKLNLDPSTLLIKQA